MRTAPENSIGQRGSYGYTAIKWMWLSCVPTSRLGRTALCWESSPKAWMRKLDELGKPSQESCGR